MLLIHHDANWHKADTKYERMNCHFFPHASLHQCGSFTNRAVGRKGCSIQGDLYYNKNIVLYIMAKSLWTLKHHKRNTQLYRMSLCTVFVILSTPLHRTH